ncbi:zinc finger domain-containing protein [Brucella anthropi]|uniref:zinc finger domain-containing protein n=1 Tax=Brucella anthropi TaxID=529 RepID=UPI001CFCA149|nr:hypothetical protein [Brucella anthropi]
MMESGPHDFTAHVHPVLAVCCPDCGKPIGVWCVRPSGHRASDLHRSRRMEADRVFIDQYGERAAINRTADGWTISR